MEKRKIILDCDPGHDDAITIMMAAKHPKIDLLGITIVAGNQTLDKTLVNGLHVCQQLGLDYPVYGGMSLPIVRDQVVAAYIHGESGLDGPVFGPLVKKAEKTHAVQFIIETLMASDGDITLVPVGPLSNIAMAMRLEPRIIPKIQEIVLMGGAYGLGNITAAAEFNIYADPEAASIVFRSGAPVVMMGLDLTSQAQCYPEIITRMEKIGNTASKLFSDIMNFVLKTQKEAYGFEGSPLHDSTCLAYLIDPDCIELKPMYTQVELRSELCYGRTVCDYFNNSDEKPNSKVAVKLDANKFWDIVEECIRLY